MGICTHHPVKAVYDHAITVSSSCCCMSMCLCDVALVSLQIAVMQGEGPSKRTWSMLRGAVRAAMSRGAAKGAKEDSRKCMRGKGTCSTAPHGTAQHSINSTAEELQTPCTIWQPCVRPMCFLPLTNYAGTAARISTLNRSCRESAKLGNKYTRTTLKMQHSTAKHY